MTLAGGPAALFNTAYGRICLAKLLLFAVLVALAAYNRLHLLARLDRGAATARAALARDIAVANIIGGLILLLAGVLSAMAPAIDPLP